MESVAVLNSDYSFVGLIGWQRSVVLLYQGKAVSVKDSETTIYNQDKTFSFVIPKVIKLVECVTSLFRNKIPYSKRNIFIRDNYTCQYCHKTLEILECTVDHVVPKVDGGRSTWDNCVTSCKRCNNIKADRPLSKSGFKLKRPPYTPNAADFIRLRSKHIIDQLW